MTYPSYSDPENIKYVLWRCDLNGINLDTATDMMIVVGDDTLDLHYVTKDDQAQASNLLARGRSDRTIYPP